MRILSLVFYIIIYLLLLIYGMAISLFPFFIRYRLQYIELILLNWIYYSGPGGFDDAIQMQIRKKPYKYSDTIRRLLVTSKYDSYKEKLALAFVEFVRVDPHVDEELKLRRDSHPNNKTQGLIDRILNDQRYKQHIRV